MRFGGVVCLFFVLQKQLVSSRTPTNRPLVGSLLKLSAGRMLFLLVGFVFFGGRVSLYCVFSFRSP